MTRPELVRTISCTGANYYNDALVVEANKFANAGKLERETPAWAIELACCHDRNKSAGYWRILLEQIAVNLSKNPCYTKSDLMKIKAPTLLMSGENDLWANRQQMLEMRASIPRSEMLILNNAGHDIQYTHPHIVGPAVMEFIERHSRT